MAFSSAFSHTSFTYSSSFSHTRKIINTPFRLPLIIKAENPSEPKDNEKPANPKSKEATSSTATAAKPKKPVYSMKKGQIVRVDKEKYLNSINYLSVDHPPYYKGLDYIYEDRGEDNVYTDLTPVPIGTKRLFPIDPRLRTNVLDLRIFETGEYALIGWIGIPTAPAWLPTEMLIKSDKLDYERI